MTPDIAHLKQAFMEKWGGEVSFYEDGSLDWTSRDKEMIADLDALLAAEREACARMAVDMIVQMSSRPLNGGSHE